MTVDIDVVIPARKGSVGLPGKNRRVLVDRPLVLHSIACAQMIARVRHILVSTDDPWLMERAQAAGAYVPSLRPDDLSTGSTPMTDVVRHALELLDEAPGSVASQLLLLDPTSPVRDPGLIEQAASRLRADPDVDGAIAISVPSFNPLWVGVELGLDGLIRRHPSAPHSYARRQDVPDFWRINGSFYLWRKDFARPMQVDWLDHGTFIGVETPEISSHSIDTLEDFRLVEVLVATGVVTLPWLGKVHDGA